MTSQNVQRRFAAWELLLIGAATFLAGLVVVPLFFSVNTLIFNNANSAPAPNDDHMSQRERAVILGNIGDAVSVGEALVTVHKVEMSDTIDVSDERTNDGDPIMEAAQPDRDGDKFVRVEATVRNVGKQKLDYCQGFFDLVPPENTIDYELSDYTRNILNNGGCLNDLGPRLERQVTWIYEVPKDFESGLLVAGGPDRDSVAIDLRGRET
ncbi:DUF4352 domain-containing protein [Corynebacterium aquatimens]|uniref:DUF4352 domain-containing protein n=1 Tax=Corynebacterium aquatimens TaxID=1190508 RepID=A0A931E0Z6_9CORY|nr:DUF4352 domain-containing protein [Corynebacterium aquatimens]MBG6122273.1 hypothetical protein [Corynebacterium aquatimens]WJY65186.1 Telomeric repeat-binding factor 2 [Corynebacterium aquatimens]